MTTFLTLGLLSGKCSHGANFKESGSGSIITDADPRILIRIRNTGFQVTIHAKIAMPDSQLYP